MSLTFNQPNLLVLAPTLIVDLVPEGDLDHPIRKKNVIGIDGVDDNLGRLNFVTNLKINSKVGNVDTIKLNFLANKVAVYIKRVQIFGLD